MAYFRVFLITAALILFLIVGAPMQAVFAGIRPRWAIAVPMAFCRTMLWLLRVRVERAGAFFAPTPMLLVANHVSWIDILVLGSTAPICFLAKREVASWPIVSTFARLQGTVFVDRSRRRGILPANRAMANRMAEGRIVLLFPEGTTYASTGRFHSSHFAAARDFIRASTRQDAVVLVQPAALAYSSDIAPWVGDDTLVSHLWRVLKAPGMTCRLSLGAPIPYARETDRKRVASASREAIVAMIAGKRVPIASEPMTKTVLVEDEVLEGVGS